jgi:hypothetical protein
MLSFIIVVRGREWKLCFKFNPEWFVPIADIKDCNAGLCTSLCEYLILPAHSLIANLSCVNLLSFRHWSHEDDDMDDNW